MKSAQALLDLLPCGCELRTSVADVGRGWEATAQIVHITDTPKPIHVGRAATDEDALERAIHSLTHYWEWRTCSVARKYPQR